MLQALSETYLPTVYLNRDGQERIKPDTYPVSPRTSVYGLVSNQDKVLLVLPVWSDQLELPGGKVEEGEAEEEALARELREETGIQAVAPYIHLYSHHMLFYDESQDRYYDSHQLFYVVPNYVLPENGFTSDHEVREVLWVAWGTLTMENTKPGALKAIHLFYQR